MEKKILKKAIKENNPWWFKDFHLEKYKDRTIYSKIKEFLNERQIIALTGLRRTGKTTLMKKIIEDKISDYDNENILYFSFDEFSDVRLRKIIEIYENMMKKNIEKENFLILFDEIQKVENWQEQIKRIYDTYNNIKFIISGSESLFIRNKSKESLAGRIFEFKINTLNFKEYLKFKGMDYKRLELNENKIKKEIHSYIISSGFPELVNKNKQFALEYINNIIDKVIDSDMPKVFDIKNTSQVREVFDVIYNDPGQQINIIDLSNELDMSRNTVSYILKCLENAFMIRKLYNYSTNTRKTQRKLKKYYPTLYNYYLTEDYFSKLFETFIVLNIDAEYFWRDSYKHEVDVVLDNKETLSGIEIKSGKIKDKKSLKVFQRKFGGNVKFVSYEQKEDKENIPIIPFYEYLLHSK